MTGHDPRQHSFGPLLPGQNELNLPPDLADLYTTHLYSITPSAGPRLADPSALLGAATWTSRPF